VQFGANKPTIAKPVCAKLLKVFRKISNLLAYLSHETLVFCQRSFACYCSPAEHQSIGQFHTAKYEIDFRQSVLVCAGRDNDPAAALAAGTDACTVTAAAFL
jgi:hypothetical protein